MASTFSEKYKNPNWQRKKSEIMRRADWTCESCGAKDKLLHVHHGYYEKDKDPWEYDDETLHCLCVDCHAKAHNLKQLVHRRIAKLSLNRLRVFAARIGVSEKRDHPEQIDAVPAE